MAIRKYVIQNETLQFASAVEANCNTITFINKGAPGDVIKIDGLAIAQGEAIEDAGNQDELNVSRYNVTANVPTFVLFIRRKIYK